MGDDQQHPDSPAVDEVRQELIQLDRKPVVATPALRSMRSIEDRLKHTAATPHASPLRGCKNAFGATLNIEWSIPR